MSSEISFFWGFFLLQIGVTIWGRHMGYSYRVSIWVCYMRLIFGVGIIGIYMGSILRVGIWVWHIGSTIGADIKGHYMGSTYGVFYKDNREYESRNRGRYIWTIVLGVIM